MQAKINYLENQLLIIIDQLNSILQSSKTSKYKTAYEKQAKQEISYIIKCFSKSHPAYYVNTAILSAINRAKQCNFDKSFTILLNKKLIQNDLFACVSDNNNTM